MDFVEIAAKLGQVGTIGILVYLLILERKRSDSLIRDLLEITSKVAGATTGTISALQSHEQLSREIRTTLDGVKDAMIWQRGQTEEIRADLASMSGEFPAVTGESGRNKAPKVPR